MQRYGVHSEFLLFSEEEWEEAKKMAVAVVEGKDVDYTYVHVETTCCICGDRVEADATTFYPGKAVMHSDNYHSSIGI